jgi:hypothetical protein
VLTFNALFEPLAAPFIGPPPLTLLSGFLLHFLTFSALGRERIEDSRVYQGLTQAYFRQDSHPQNSKDQSWGRGLYAMCQVAQEPCASPHCQLPPH